MNIILISLSIAYLLLVWFETNVCQEYAKLFHIKWFKFGEYFEYLKEHLGYITYLDYLKKEYGENFFIKLVLCPICVCFWSSLFASFIVGVQYFLAIAALSLTFYFTLKILFDKSH